MRTLLALVVGRVLRVLIRQVRKGGGSALPGLVVSKLAPNLLANSLKKFRDGLVVVTGSAGKSTTTKMLVSIVRAHGVEVFTNPSTANILQGFFSSIVEKATVFGKLPGEVAILEMDEAMCLAAGADDYITKPVSARILALRASTQIRHLAAINQVDGSVITAGPISLDTNARHLVIEKKPIALTRTEYDFLNLLISNPKRVFTREEIATAIGTSHEYSSDHLLDTHASRIRMKIKEVSDIKVLHAVRGVGYRLLSN